MTLTDEDTNSILGTIKTSYLDDFPEKKTPKGGGGSFSIKQICFGILNGHFGHQLWS